MAAAVRGWKQVIRNLSNYNNRTVRRVVSAVQATQAQVINEARTLVPVITGNLQNSIGPGKIVIRQGSVEARVFALMDYANFVEFGTSKQKAKAFLGPAILRHQGTFRSNIQKAMRP